MPSGRVLAILLRQLYLMQGSFSRVFSLFAWIAVDMVLWGFLTRYLNTVAGSGRIDFVPVLLGAVLLWDVFIRVMQGVMMAFFEDVWSRNFLNIFATPILIGEYAAGLVLASVATSVVGVAVIVAIAFTCFGLSPAIYGVMAAPFVSILFLFGVALGIFASAIVLRFGPASEWFIWPIPALLSPFVGVLYPISTLPQWMQAVSRILPPSYVFEALRAIVAGRGVSVAGLMWSAILACGYILLSYWIFVKVYKGTLRTGLIARYSAETLS